MILNGFRCVLGKKVSAASGGCVVALLEVCNLGTPKIRGLDDSMIRCIEAGGLEAWRLAAWRMGGVGSLDAGGNESLGVVVVVVLAAWMLVARMMRMVVRMVMNGDKDGSWEQFPHARA